MMHGEGGETGVRWVVEVSGVLAEEGSAVDGEDRVEDDSERAFGGTYRRLIGVQEPSGLVWSKLSHRVMVVLCSKVV